MSNTTTTTTTERIDLVKASAHRKQMHEADALAKTELRRLREKKVELEEEINDAEDKVWHTSIECEEYDHFMSQRFLKDLWWENNG